MTKKVTTETRFDFPPEKLLEVLTHPEFQQAQRKMDHAVVDARFEEETRTEDRLVFNVVTTEYERGLTGLNKRKTFESVTRNEWDLKKRTAKWSYSSPQTGRASIGGSNRIDAAGDGARLTFEANIEVRVPLIGKKAEQKIAEGMKKGRTGYDSLAREWSKKI